MFIAFDKILGSCPFDRECPAGGGGGVCPFSASNLSWKCKNGFVKISCEDYIPCFLLWEIRLLFFKIKAAKKIKSILKRGSICR